MKSDGCLIESFATRHKLKLHRDADRTHIVLGKQGHIYQFDDDRLGVCFTPGSGHARMWGFVRRGCQEVGMALLQNGDYEGCLSFDPSDKEQARTAVKAVRAKTKRGMSAAQTASLQAARQAKRSNRREKAEIGTKPIAGEALQPLGTSA